MKINTVPAEGWTYDYEVRRHEGRASKKGASARHSYSTVPDGTQAFGSHFVKVLSSLFKVTKLLSDFLSFI